MSFVLPPIVKLAERLLVDIEHAVARFGRGFKYGFGAALREQAMHVALVAHRAWRDRAHQVEHIADLVRAVDDLKLRLQVGQRIHAFTSFAQFEQLARTASALGKQTGGWHRQQQHPMSQSGHRDAGGQRAPILSSRTTPAGVNP